MRKSENNIIIILFLEKALILFLNSEIIDLKSTLLIKLIYYRNYL
jgi:hypothetical protein